MSNEEARSSLRSLRAENSRTDQVFGQVKKFGNRFDAALAEIFFGNSQLKELTQKYGVF